MNDYSFSKFDVFKIPSVYGKNDGTKVEYFMEKSPAYYKKLVGLIAKQIEIKRPVIVGFSSYSALNKFEESPEFKSLNISCNYLHLKLDDELRDRAIKLAGCKGKLTLMTS